MKKDALISIFRACFFIGIGLAALSLINLIAQEQDLSADNISCYVGNGRWDWTIFIKGSDEVIRSIDCVEYMLHPTFLKPLHRVTKMGSPSYPFGLTMNGWGTFTIPIKVIFKNGRIRNLKHMLVFVSNHVDKPLQIRAENTSSPFGLNQREWTILICGSSEDLDQIKLVQYSLSPLFSGTSKREVYEVFERGSGKFGFAFSGVGKEEFDIEIRVFYKSGRYQDLRHHIRF